MGKRLFWFLGILVLLQILLFEQFAQADQSADFGQITSAIGSGNALEAQSLIEEFLEKNPIGPLSIKARYLLGQLQYRRAAYREAAEIFSKLLVEHSDWEHGDRAKYGLALAQIGMLDFSNASRTLESFLSTYLESDLRPDALYWLGECFYRQRQYSAASGRFERFLQLYPVHELREYALDSAGWCLEQLERYSEAAERRRQFLVEFKKSSLTTNVRFCLAADLMKTGERRLAAEQYLQTAGSDPASHLQKQALLRAGLLFAELGDSRKAVVALEKAIPIIIDEEKLPLAREVLGNCYLKMTIYEKAKPIFEGLLREGNVYAPAIRLELALVLMGMGSFDDASVILAIDDALIENPALEEIRCLLLANSLL
jgi:TolA-binding protein